MAERFHQEGDIVVAVDEFSGFPTDTINVRILQRTRDSAIAYGPNKIERFTESEPMSEQLDTELVWRIPRAAVVALGNALIGQAPASQQLVDLLSKTLDREQTRVDKFIDNEIA